MMRRTHWAEIIHHHAIGILRNWWSHTNSFFISPPAAWCLMYRLPDLLPAPSLSPHSLFSVLRFSLSASRNNKTNTARCEIQTLEPDNWSVVWRGRGPGATRGVKTDTRNPASFRGQLIIGLITNKQLQSAIIPRRSFSSCHAIASFYRKNKSLSRNSSRGKIRRRFDANTRMSFTSCLYLEWRLIDSLIEVCYCNKDKSVLQWNIHSSFLSDYPWQDYITSRSDVARFWIFSSHIVPAVVLTNIPRWSSDHEPGQVRPSDLGAR